VDRRLAALACSQSDRAVEWALAGCGERRGAGGSAKGKESDGEDESMARGGREDGGEGAGSRSGEQVQEVVHGRKEAGAGGGQEAGAEGRREEEVQHKEERETSRETEREREEEARLYRRAAAITGESAASIGIFFFILSCRSHHRRICCFYRSLQLFPSSLPQRPAVRTLSLSSPPLSRRALPASYPVLSASL
jgi:hypothetical protein